MAASTTPILSMQLAGVVVGFGLMALAPPADGLQLLVPLSGTAQASMLPLAIARGGQLVGRGPLPGSIVVRGLHAALAAPLAMAGIVTLAAPATACGQLEGDYAER